MVKPNPRQYVRIPISLLTTGKVKASTIATYAAIASFADRKGFSFPSVPSIAKRAGLSKKVARRECNNLVQLGLLERKAHFDATQGQRSNRYILTWQRDEIENTTSTEEQNRKSSPVDIATPPSGDFAGLTKSIVNQRQQTILVAEIVENTWSAEGKTQKKEGVIRLVGDALNNGITPEELRTALEKLNQINIYVSAYSLSTALHPKPKSKLSADKKVDWSKLSDEF